MKKETTPVSGSSVPADETKPPEATAQETGSAPEPEIHFDPNHEWPATGGCYVRQADGTLERED